VHGSIGVFRPEGEAHLVAGFTDLSDCLAARYRRSRPLASMPGRPAAGH
jgi:hypothetical protein